MSVWKFNKGEWSEAYVFLKLLADGRIYSMKNAKSEEVDDAVYMDIQNILRYESAGEFRYERVETEAEIVMQAFKNNEAFAVITCKELTDRASYLYTKIKEISGKVGAIERTQEELIQLGFSSPKAPALSGAIASLYGAKSDIILTGINPLDRTYIKSGYSIKSNIGNPPTLFNCSQTSGFLYRLEGCNDSIMHEINGISSETALVRKVFSDERIKPYFLGGRNQDFIDNIKYIDLKMAEVLDTVLLINLGCLKRADTANISDITVKLAEVNPLKVNYPEEWYTAKMKEFLYAAFSGMTASQHWDGRRKMSGGYINVSADGKLVYYRAMSDDDFSNYLFYNTKIDRPSRGINKDIAHLYALATNESRNVHEDELYRVTHNSKGVRKSKKGDWGYVYREGDCYYIAINFQIRFK